MPTAPEQPTPHERRPTTGRRSAGQWMRSGVLIAVTAIAVLFAVLNLGTVKVDWVIGSGHAPLIIVIGISVLAGIVLTYAAERIIHKRRQ